jgi:hypothetical protein
MYTERQSDLTDQSIVKDGTDAVRARIAALEIKPAASVADTLPAVKRSALGLKHPSRSEWIFNRGEKSGPIVRIDVTDATLDRALLLADSLLRAAEAIGWSFVATPAPKVTEDRRGREAEAPKPTTEPSSGRLLVEGEHVALRIEERLRDELVMQLDLQDELPPNLWSQEPLLIDEGTGRAWYRGQELTKLQPNSHPFRFAALVARAKGKAVGTNQLNSILSHGRDDSSTAKTAKADFIKAVKASYKADRREPPADVSWVFASIHGGYRLNVGALVLPLTPVAPRWPAKAALTAS